MIARLDTESRHRIPVYLDEEALGLSMKELAVDVVEGESMDFLSRWFHSSKHEADLVIWTDGEKRVVKGQICFFGQVIEWNPLDGTRTGLVVEEETNIGEEDMAEIIRFDKKPVSGVVDQAIRVLKFVPEISEDDKSLLIHCLRESPRLHKQARERALKAWAPRVDEISSQRRPTFWKRLRKWFLGSS